MDSLIGPGLVLRRKKHLDNDVRLLVLMRDHGKVAAVSRGGQKLNSKLKALQEPFTEAEFHIFATHDGHNGRLAGDRLIDSHMGLRKNHEAFVLANRCAEVVDMLLPYRAPASDVYDILRRSLAELVLQPHPLIVWISFVVRLMKTLGHGDLSEQIDRLPAGSTTEASVALVERELSLILPRAPKSEIEVA